MKKNLFSALLIAMVSIVLAACGSSSETSSKAASSGSSEEEITIKHELGEAVVKKNPKKVVVFDFGALDTLDKLGVDVAGVAKSSTLPEYLSKYESDQYENVGSLKEPDFEKIYSMEPDLILISGRQSSAYEELNDIAPTVFIGVDHTNYMESFKNNVKTLAKIFDKEELAEKELTKIDKKIDALNEKVSSSDKKGLITLTTGGKVSAYGPGSRFGIIHDVFGVKAADRDIEASNHGMSITFEYIAKTNPDYLFVIDRDKVVSGEGNASKVFDNELVNKTKAAQNDKIIYLDPAVWYLSGGGLTSVSEMVKEVEEGIN
ncbi:siderophore ABC transporter substrate-binding protein [Pseudalkalibacillus decolorationis]|uniref:siderophore ABC transporter substrate-binding protein n=1 Tax=Pseudalkalibacillus decolorationis TaxID=163879 RepID=UPI0021481C7D|nr:siderophore ABC transporter substrate-binding protein [Pseudalkalibacillus decolorationis]